MNKGSEYSAIDWKRALPWCTGQQFPQPCIGRWSTCPQRWSRVGSHPPGWCGFAQSTVYPLSSGQRRGDGCRTRLRARHHVELYQQTTDKKQHEMNTLSWLHVTADPQPLCLKQTLLDTRSQRPAICVRRHISKTRAWVTSIVSGWTAVNFTPLIRSEKRTHKTSKPEEEGRQCNCGQHKPINKKGQ